MGHRRTCEPSQLHQGPVHGGNLEPLGFCSQSQGQALSSACPSEGGLLQALCPTGRQRKPRLSGKETEVSSYLHSRLDRVCGGGGQELLEVDLFRPAPGSVYPGTRCRIPGAEGISRKRVQFAWSMARQHTSAILAPGRRRQGHLEFKVSLGWSKSLSVTSQPVLSPRLFRS